MSGALAHGNYGVVRTMKPEEVMVMTDEQLLIKAAELMGWEDVALRDVNNLLDEAATFKAVCAKPDSGPNADEDAIGWLVGDGENMWDVVPDYPNDITAAWELEEFVFSLSHDGEIEGNLFDTTWSEKGAVPGLSCYQNKPFIEYHPIARYVQALSEIVSVDLLDISDNDFRCVDYGQLWRMVHASPKDITRAFIIAMGEES